MYDLHPDGKRVALASPEITSEAIQNKLAMVFNLFDELRRVLP